MSQAASFRIRRMQIADIDQAFGLSIAEGWNQTLDDWKFLALNPCNICIVAEKDFRITGSATALIHDRKLAWIGMVLVDKSLRGLGAGRMLMEKLLQLLGTELSVKLDATPAGEPLYSKLGFRPEYTIVRMTCARILYNKLLESVSIPQNIGANDINRLSELDGNVLGVDRSCLLHHLASGFPDICFYIENNGRIQGFIQGRKGSHYTYLGPLTATSDVAAMNLISSSLRHQNDQNFALDVPGQKQKLIQWLESIGFVSQRQFTRMYLEKNSFPGEPSLQYLISGPEFG